VKKRFIGIKEICKLADRSFITIDRWVAAGTFPAPEKVSNAKIWLREEVYQALRERGVQIDE